MLNLNQYMIREKFWKIFGNKFWFEDVNEKRHGFCEQKRFKLKEDIRIYVDESKSQEWLKIKQKQIKLIKLKNPSHFAAGFFYLDID